MIAVEYKKLTNAPLVMQSITTVETLAEMRSVSKRKPHLTWTTINGQYVSSADQFTIDESLPHLVIKD